MPEIGHSVAYRKHVWQQAIEYLGERADMAVVRALMTRTVRHPETLTQAYRVLIASF